MNILKNITVQRFSDELKTGMIINVKEVIAIDSAGNKTYMLDDDVEIYDVDEEFLTVKYNSCLINISVEDVINGFWEISTSNKNLNL